MRIVAQTAAAMQAVFGKFMDELAKSTGCVQRERKFSGSTLLETLVFTLLQHPAAKNRDYRTIAAQLGIDVTDQAIEGRFSSGLVNFLQTALQHAIAVTLQAMPPNLPLLHKFSQVVIGDSTSISLPDELADQFPGCGGSGEAGKAALKIQVAWDLIAGGLKLLIEAGRASDAKSPIVQTPSSVGSLSIFDLGYFSLERFARVGAAKAYWISRFQHGTQVFDDSGKLLDLQAFLRDHAKNGVVDVCLAAGREERLPCRLIAIRVPPEVANRRRQRISEKARDHGREPSQAYLDIQEWTIFITNCGPELLTWKEVVVLYRARWQIELLFKLWKSHNRIAERETDATPERQMAVLYAKLVGVIIQHWLLLTTVWNDGRRSLRRAAAILRDWIGLFIESLGDLERTCNLLRRLGIALAKSARVSKRRKHPSLFQLLENSELLEYTAA
jgi:hypothetical protein